MKKFILSVIGSTFALSLVACNNATPNMMLSRSGVQSLRAAQPAPGKVRSDAVLDAVAKRMRFVSFQSLDRNRDNQLSPQEFPFAAPGTNFAGFDKNKDGQLSFTEFDKAMQTSSPYGINRDLIRSQAQGMWQMINKDNNQVLLRAEVEEYFTAPYNNPMPIPVAPPVSEPTPIASGEPTGYPDPGYGSGYGQGYAPPNYEQLKYEARKQAIDFFVQADVNLDQKLSFSEYEDGFAKQALSSSENNLGNNYPYYYPPVGVAPGYPSGGYGSPYGSPTVRR